MRADEDLFAILSKLILVAGVSGNEERVAEVVEGHLEEIGFAAGVLECDGMGNRWLHLGPEGDPQRLLVAHLDEIGLRITSVRDDGFCCVTPVGSIDPQLWEGTAVVVHTADGVVPGCIAPVSMHVTGRQRISEGRRLTIGELMLDLGARSAAEVGQLGVSMLDSVTWPKSITRVAGDLIQARSLDDRFGCAALLAAAGAMVDQHPSVPTVLAWSAQEEVGLRGARQLAQRFPRCQEVIAVDSFAVGLGPRDIRQYDGPLPGAGPILRSWDSTTLVPDVIRRELLAKATDLGYRLQYGFMPGGNDSSMFESTGARVFAFSVTVQYSHTAAERIHMGDLQQLCGLIAAWCQSDC